MFFNKNRTGIACAVLGCRNRYNLVAPVIGWINKLGKVLNFCTRGRQNLGNTVGGWPSWLPFFGPTLALIKRRWVKTAAFCQP